MAKNRVITVRGIPVTVSDENIDDYICITDIAAARSDNSRAADVIKNWMRTRSTLEFLGTWEQIYNPNFKVVEFDHFKMEAGLPTFTMSVTDWVDSTHARESWHGRMRACRGTSASMSPAELALWNDEHIKMLSEYSDSFVIKHYVSIAWLKKK